MYTDYGRASLEMPDSLEVMSSWTKMWSPGKDSAEFRI